MKSMKFLLTIILICVETLSLPCGQSEAAKPIVACDLGPSGVSQQGQTLIANVPGVEQRSKTVRNIRSRAVYFVSLSGNDKWSGRLPAPAADKTDGPFATIERARDTIRTDKERMPENGGGIIYLRNGEYMLKQPVVFTAQDAGTRLEAFHGEHPKLVGAITLRASKEDDTGRFGAPLPDDPGREIFVGDMRQFLAFKPSANPDGWRTAANLAAANSFMFQPGEIEAQQGGSDLKVELFDDARSLNVFTTVVSLDVSAHIARVSPSDRGPVSNVGSFRLVGNPAWITRKGQFGWDSVSQRLILKPTDASALMHSGLRIPVVHSLLIFREANDNAVVGLSFAQTGTASSNELESAAIVLQSAHDVIVSGNDFHNVGEAIRLVGSSRNFIADNAVSETGSHGIELQDQSDGNLIIGNNLTGIGRIEKSAAAIYLHGAMSNRIAHNLIQDTSRHGIGIDNWDDQTINIANIVEYNRLWRTNLETNDTGAIEMLGRSRIDTTSIVRFNDIADVGKFGVDLSESGTRPLAASGIYLDDLTSGVLVCGNNIRGAPLAAIHLHGGSNVEIRNNIAILDRPDADFVFLQGADPSAGGRRFDFTWHPPAIQPPPAGQPQPDGHPDSVPVKAATLTGTREKNHQVEVRFDNDAVVNGQDRDLFVSKIEIGSQAFPATELFAHYHVDDGRVMPGQVSLPWNGALIWEIPGAALGSADTPVSVFAWGNPAGGVGAHFTLTIDGRSIGDAEALSPPDEMRDNKITRNIVYATKTGKTYYKNQRGSAQIIASNDYFDLTGNRDLSASGVIDTAPILADPEFLGPAKGDYRLRPSSGLWDRGFTDIPVLPGKGG